MTCRSTGRWQCQQHSTECSVRYYSNWQLSSGNIHCWQLKGGGLESFQFIYHVHKIISSTVCTTRYKNTLKHKQTNKQTHAFKTNLCGMW